MAASLTITGFINRISSSKKGDKTSYFARLAYSTGRKDENEKYPMQYLDVVLANNLKGKGVEKQVQYADNSVAIRPGGTCEVCCGICPLID